MTLITNENDELVLTVDMDPTVVDESYLTISHGGEVLGTISATFDFSNLPPELHQMALNTIARHRMSLCLSEGAVNEIAKRSWLDKILGRNNG